jgi:hypothetical protein
MSAGVVWWGILAAIAVLFYLFITVTPWGKKWFDKI